MSDGAAPRRADGTQVFWLLTLMALVVLAPNLFLFSFDDVFIAALPRPFDIAGDQAWNGRYAFTCFIVAAQRLGLSYPAFQGVSMLLLATGLAFLFQSLRAVGGAALRREGAIVFFGLFVTFGLLADVFQFTFAYAQYGAAFWAAGFALRLAFSGAPLLLRVAGGIVIGWVACGFYQLYPAVVLAATLGLAFLHVAGGGGVARWWQGALVLAVGLVGAALLYLATNAALKAGGHPWFANYPARPQGLGFVLGNLPRYGTTLGAMLNPWSPSYGFLNTPLLHVALVISLMALTLVTLLRRRPWPVLLLAVAILGAVVTLPNPANLPLQTFWPSPRSASAAALIACCLLMAAYLAIRSDLPRLRPAMAAGVTALFLLQAVHLARLQQFRYATQQQDLALANAIMQDAFRLTRPGEPIQLRLRADWLGSVRGAPMSHDYGTSLFASAHAAPSLLMIYSGGRIQATAAAPEECRDVTARLSVRREGEALIACLIGP